MFYAKGAQKSQVQIEHSKLASESAASKWKAYWKKELGKLAEMLEG
jgi:hypothetical protein